MWLGAAMLTLVLMPQTVLSAVWLWRDSAKNRVWLRRAFAINLVWNVLGLVVTTITILFNRLPTAMASSVDSGSGLGILG